MSDADVNGLLLGAGMLALFFGLPHFTTWLLDRPQTSVLNRRRSRAQLTLLAQQLHVSNAWDCDCWVCRAEKKLKRFDVPRGREVERGVVLGIPYVKEKR